MPRRCRAHACTRQRCGNPASNPSARRARRARGATTCQRPLLALLGGARRPHAPQLAAGRHLAAAHLRAQAPAAMRRRSRAALWRHGTPHAAGQPRAAASQPLAARIGGQPPSAAGTAVAGPRPWLLCGHCRRKRPPKRDAQSGCGAARPLPRTTSHHAAAPACWGRASEPTRSRLHQGGRACGASPLEPHEPRGSTADCRLAFGHQRPPLASSKPVGPNQGTPAGWDPSATFDARSAAGLPCVIPHDTFCRAPCADLRTRLVPC